jgi:hypothetical protein
MLNLKRVLRTFDFEKFITDMKLKSSLVLFSFIGIAGIAFLVNRTHPTQKQTSFNTKVSDDIPSISNGSSLV